MLFNDEGDSNNTFDNDEQSLNDSRPIEFTEEGIVICVTTIEVTEEGINACVNNEYPINDSFWKSKIYFLLDLSDDDLVTWVDELFGIVWLVIWSTFKLDAILLYFNKFNNEEGILTSFNFFNPIKAISSIFFTESGISIFVNDSHPWKQDLPIETNEGGNSIFF